MLPENKEANDGTVIKSIICSVLVNFRIKLFQICIIRSNRSEMFCKRAVLRNFAKYGGKHLCQSLFFNNVAGLRLPGVGVSCEFFEIFKSNFYAEHLWITASALFSPISTGFLLNNFRNHIIGKRYNRREILCKKHISWI